MSSDDWRVASRDRRRHWARGSYPVTHFHTKNTKYVNCDISDKLDMRHRLELVSTCDVRFEESGL